MKAIKFLIFLLIILIPASSFFNVIDIENYHFFTPGMFISISATFFTVVYLFIKRFKVILPLNIVDITVLAYFSYCLFSIVFSGRNILKNDDFILQIVLISTYFVLKHFFSSGNTDETKNSLLYLVLIFCFIPVIISVFEIVRVVEHDMSSVPVFGGFSNPGMFANYLAAIIPFIFSFIILENNQLKWQKLLLTGCFVVTLVLIIVLNARTAWISVIITLLYVSFQTQKIKQVFAKIKWKLWIPVIIPVVISFVFFLYHYKKDSADGRLYIWKTNITLIKEKPIFGHGYNSYQKAFNEASIAYFEKNPNDQKNMMLTSDAFCAFNDYLQITSELGIVGLLLFLSIVFTSFKGYTNNNSNKVIAVKSGIAGILICGFFSYPFETPLLVFLFYFYLAYISTSIKPHNRSEISKKWVIVPVLAGLFLMAMAYIQVRTSYYRIGWKQAKKLYEQNQIPEALEQYRKLKPALTDNYYFLFNYASVLYNTGDYQQSIELFESAKQIETYYDLYLDLGQSYKAIKNYSKAEECFNKASNLIPFMILPKFALFRIYKETNRPDDAYLMAEKISKMPVKIYSTTVGQIKKEAIEYLRQKKETN